MAIPWLPIAQAAAPVAGGLLGSVFGSDQNIDRSPGLQQQSKGLFHTAYPELRRLMQQRSDFGQDVGVSPLFTRGVESVEGAIPGMTPQIEAAQGAWRQGLSAPDMAQNPYMQGILDMIGERGGRQFREEIQPALRRSAIAGGMYGGGRSGVNEGVAAGRVAQGVSDAQRQALMQGYGQGLGHQARMLGMAPSMAGLGLLPGQELMRTGTAAQGANITEMQAEQLRRAAQIGAITDPLSAWSRSHTTQFGGVPSPENASGAAQGIGIGSMVSGLLPRIMGGMGQSTQNVPQGFGNPMPWGGGQPYMSAQDPWSISSQWGQYNPMQNAWGGP